MSDILIMPAPCVGTLQKTHRKSQFKRFHVTSEMAKYVFSDTPRTSRDGDEIVILQLMTFGDNELLMEYVNKVYWGGLTMARKEEINQQAEEYRQPYRDGGYRLSSKDVRDAFKEGAERADKTMIEKACEWMKLRLVARIGSEDAHEFLTEFRKAMEE